MIAEEEEEAGVVTRSMAKTKRLETVQLLDCTAMVAAKRKQGDTSRDQQDDIGVNSFSKKSKF